MGDFLKGIIYSFILLIVFLLFRIAFGLWSSFILSLALSTIIFIIITKKKNATSKKVILNSLGTGMFFSIFASIGIALFPKEQIRDAGDVIMPYINAFAFGMGAFLIFTCFGFLSLKAENRTPQQ